MQAPPPDPFDHSLLQLTQDVSARALPKCPDLAIPFNSIGET